uniref:Uncharacterized protein n=1 Tax=Rhizophora mucronata TaxID=61149 RepID=A0A2P2NDM9_RHIMU
MSLNRPKTPCLSPNFLSSVFISCLKREFSFSFSLILF